MTVANARVAGTLFKMATSGECVAATIFWAKCRLHWSDQMGPMEGADQRSTIPHWMEEALRERRTPEPAQLHSGPVVDVTPVPPDPTPEPVKPHYIIPRIDADGQVQ